MDIQSTTIVRPNNYQYINSVGHKAPSSELTQAGDQTKNETHHSNHTSREHSIAEKQVLQSIEQVLQALQGPKTTLEMKIHEETNQVIVRVLNSDTGDVIREVPPEKMQDLVAKMVEIAGLLVDKKV